MTGPATQGVLDSTKYEVREFGDWRELLKFREQWDELSRKALEPAPACEHWMLIPSLKHVAGSADVRVVLVTSRGQGAGRLTDQLCGVFPIHLRSLGEWRPPTLAMWHHMYAISAIPLVARADAAGCVAAFLGWVRQTAPSTALLQMPEVCIEGKFYGCLMAALAAEGLEFEIVSTWARAHFRPARDAETYVAGLGNAHHRKEWRRLERRLSEHGQLAYDELQPDGDVQAWLSALATLEATGWKGERGTAFASNPGHLAWLREVGTEAFARRRLMMLALRLDGVPVAIKLNVLGGGGGYAFKIAFDERFDKYSPGVLLELENIRRLHDRPDVLWMDSLAAPGHSLVERVWSDRAAFASLLIAPGRLAGRLLLAARPMLRLAKRAARRPP